jgi:antitoxin HicB
MKKNLNYYMNLKYEIIVKPDEDGFVAYIPELPGCITQADKIQEVFPMLADAKKSWLEIALKQKLEIPEPKSLDDFSGKFNLRLPKSIHKKLYEQAQKENVSINQLALCYIAEGLGQQTI